MLKNKFFAIIMLLMLIQPIYATEDADINVVQADSLTVESIENTVPTDIERSVLDDEINTISDEQIAKTTFKQPVSKKKILKKFLLAMLGVIISSVAILIGLSIYNKIRNSLLETDSSEIEQETSLKTPDNIHDAIKSFVDKTRWEN